MTHAFRALLTALALVAATPSFALTVVVDTGMQGQGGCNDDDVETTCSLRDAITFLNTQTGVGGETPPYHTINFDPESIGVENDVATVFVQNGDLPDVVVPVQIMGPAIDDGVDPAVQVSCLSPGGSEDPPAAFAFVGAQSDDYRIENLSITNCVTQNARGGGAIYFNPQESNGVPRPSAIEITSVIISGTSAAAGPGGAIKIAAEQTAIVSDTRISDATASTFGGAIDNEGFLTVTNSILSNNSLVTSVFTPSNGAGAGLSSRLDATGSTLLNRVVISGNAAGTDDGGGIYAEKRLATLVWEIQDSQIIDNTAANGAGLAVGLGGPITVSGTTLTANVASTSGGGIYLGITDSRGGSIAASNCTISGNEAATGAGVAADSANARASSMVNCTVAFNGSDAPFGGGEGYGFEIPANQLDDLFPGNSDAPFHKNLLVGNIPANCSGTFSHDSTLTAGSNVASDSTCGFTQQTDTELSGVGQALISPTLSASSNTVALPGDTGLLMHRLLVGSPAIDAGNQLGTASDQRGAPAADGLNDDTTAVIRDAGAYEFAGFSAVEFENPSMSVDEDDSPLQFRLQRYGDLSAAAAGIAVVLEGGTGEGEAEAGVDFTSPTSPSVVTIAAGETLSELISVEIDDDTSVEADEVFSLLLAGETTWDLGTQQPVTATINDIEVGTVEFEFDDSEDPFVVNENDGNVSITLTRTGGTDKAVSVLVNSTDGTASSVDNEDYVAIEDLLITFDDGEATQTFNVAITDDDDFELDNISFSLGLSLPDGADNPANFALGDNSTLDVEIDSNDAAMAGQFSFTEASIMVTEGTNSNATFSVQRLGGTDCTVTVDYATSNGTADAGSDFTARSGSLVFEDGDDTTKTFDVPISDDAQREGDERFSVSLSFGEDAVSGCESGAEAMLDEPSSAQGIIRSNEVVRFQFDQASWAENENAGSIEISVSPLDPITGDDIVIAYATDDGTALAPEDYTATSGTLTWSDGDGLETTRSFTVPLVADDDAEGAEMFTVALMSQSEAATIEGASSTPVTIEDRLGIRFTETAFRSDRENGGTVTVALERVGSLELAAQVDVMSVDGSGTATEEVDYDARSVTVTWAADEGGTKNVTFDVLPDTQIEGDETFSVTLLNPVNAVIVEPSTATATITDDDNAVTLDATTYSVVESAGEVTLSLTRTGSVGAISVDYATADDSAIAGQDYTMANGTIEWADGENGPKTFTVPVLNNDTPEAARTFSVAISNPMPSEDVVLGNIQSADITIADDDSLITMDTAEVTVAEDAGMVTVSATRSGTALGDAAVTVSTADGSAVAPGDYTTTTSTLSWADGETGSRSVTIPIVDDQLVNDTVAFTASLSEATPSATTHIAAENSTSVMITNNDSSIMLDMSTATVTEGDGMVTISATRIGSFGAASVDYQTADGTAEAGTHYTATSGTLSWADGETGTKMLSVPILDDAGVNDPRDFTVSLINATPANRVFIGAQAQATVTIESDDTVIAMATATASAEEGDGTVTISAVRSGSTIGAASVTISTTDGTATAPTHYTALNGTLSWADGESGTKSATVTLVDNSVVNADRVFTVSLSEPSPSATVSIAAEDTTAVTVIDDETVITLDMESYVVVEGGTVTLSATRSGSASGAATVTYSTVDGTATAPSHYTAATGTLNWADGETGSKSFTVDVNDDATLNVDRVFTVDLTEPTPGARVLLGDTASAEVTIEDNETQVRFERDAYTADEGDGSVDLTVLRIGMGAGAVTVDYEVSGGSAINGTDYVLADGTITWANGDTDPKAIRVTLTEDAIAEATETVVITLSNVTSSGEDTPLGAPSSAALSIEDNDDVGFVVESSGSSLTVTEGGTAGTATVVLASRPTANVTVSFETPSRLNVRTANPADASRLVFTPSNWNVSQTVELIAVDDNVQQETETLTVTARTQSSDNNYNNLSSSLQFTVVDDDGNSGGSGGSGALGGGVLIALGGLAALRRRRWLH